MGVLNVYINALINPQLILWFQKFQKVYVIQNIINTVATEENKETWFQFLLILCFFLHIVS